MREWENGEETESQSVTNLDRNDSLENILKSFDKALEPFGLQIVIGPIDDSISFFIEGVKTPESGKMPYAVTYDDGNNYYGNVELQTYDLNEIVKYILEQAEYGACMEPNSTTSAGLDGVWIKNDLTNVRENAEPESTSADTEVVFVGANPNGKQEDEGYYGGTWSLVKYCGPRDDAYRMKNWLEEFTDHQFDW